MKHKTLREHFEAKQSMWTCSCISSSPDLSVFFFHNMVRTALTSVNTYQWTASLREPRPLGELGVGSVKSVINECLCGTSHYETPEGEGWRGWRIFRFCHEKTHMIPLKTGKLSAWKIKLRSQSRCRFFKWSMISRSADQQMRARFLSTFSEQQISVRRQHTEYNRLYLKLNLNTLPKIIYYWSWLLITDIGDL